MVQPAVCRRVNMPLVSILSWRTRKEPSISGIPDAVALLGGASLAGYGAMLTVAREPRAVHRPFPAGGPARAAATARNASAISADATAVATWAIDHRVVPAVSAAATSSLCRRPVMKGW